MKAKAWVVVLGVVVSGLLVSEVSRACGGGGIVSSRPGSVAANAQRVLLSVHLQNGAGGVPTTTDVITQIGIPDTTGDYGALLPLPSEPTLDPTPVSASELEMLDELTAPRIIEREASESSGCGCLGAAGGGLPSKGETGSGASVSEPVNIGPVTAVVLTGTTDAVNGWLADNGFVISAADQATVANYVGYYFVAIRRNERAAPGGPTSIGIHFTMSGDHRELPLRFASLGAAPTVAFTVFVAVAELAGPSPPFTALTLADLDPERLRTGGYAQAVQSAVAAHGNQAFILESRTRAEQLSTLSGTRIATLIDRGSTLTRMSTILPAAALSVDAHFYAPYEAEVPSDRYVSNSRSLGAREASLGSLAALLLAGAWRRRVR